MKTSPKLTVWLWISGLLLSLLLGCIVVPVGYRHHYYGGGGYYHRGGWR